MFEVLHDSGEIPARTWNAFVADTGCWHNRLCEEVVVEEVRDGLPSVLLRDKMVPSDADAVRIRCGWVRALDTQSDLRVRLNTYFANWIERHAGLLHVRLDPMMNHGARAVA
ncbi:hypothetical protein [Thioalkalivibrio thiocyanodenitrificans]|uniref:hypothetical protein n=1 Tax=Thioalkalivibrio thiocyanodenitrificans TaxID=243063 RepID=UPI00037926DA|nr:hypothetical protein [Thioalkalivibrio thiocyanodenitrificans]